MQQLTFIILNRRQGSQVRSHAGGTLIRNTLTHTYETSSSVAQCSKHTFYLPLSEPPADQSMNKNVMLYNPLSMSRIFLPTFSSIVHEIPFESCTGSSGADVVCREGVRSLLRPSQHPTVDLSLESMLCTNIDRSKTIRKVELTHMTRRVTTVNHEAQANGQDQFTTSPFLELRKVDCQISSNLLEI